MESQNKPTLENVTAAYEAFKAGRFELRGHGTTLLVHPTRWEQIKKTLEAGGPVQLGVDWGAIAIHVSPFVPLESPRRVRTPRYFKFAKWRTVMSPILGFWVSPEPFKPGNCPGSVVHSTGRYQ